MVLPFHFIRNKLKSIRGGGTVRQIGQGRISDTILRMIDRQRTGKGRSKKRRVRRKKFNRKRRRRLR